MTQVRGLQVIVFLVILTVIVCFVVPYSLKTAVAQDSPSTMQELLESLNERTHSEPGFSIHFSFSEPLFEGQDAWVIPTGDTSSLRHITIDKIGTDYICFGDLGGAAYGVRCTPFSNIVQVFWLDN